MARWPPTYMYAYYHYDACVDVCIYQFVHIYDTNLTRAIDIADTAIRRRPDRLDHVVGRDSTFERKSISPVMPVSWWPPQRGHERAMILLSTVRLGHAFNPIGIDLIDVGHLPAGRSDTVVLISTQGSDHASAMHAYAWCQCRLESRGFTGK